MHQRRRHRSWRPLASHSPPHACTSPCIAGAPSLHVLLLCANLLLARHRRPSAQASLCPCSLSGAPLQRWPTWRAALGNCSTRPVPPPCRACRRDKQSAMQCSACPQCLLPAAHAEGTGDQPCSACSLEKDALCSKTLKYFVLFQLILVSCPFYR